MRLGLDRTKESGDKAIQWVCFLMSMLGVQRGLITEEHIAAILLQTG